MTITPITGATPAAAVPGAAFPAFAEALPTPPPNMAPDADLAIQVLIEFTPGTWTDVTSRVVPDGAGSIRWRGGRSTRYDEVAAASVSVPLTNFDGRFTPGNPSSPHAGNLVRGKRIKLKITPPGYLQRELITGFITRWAVTIPEGNPADAQTLVEASDILSILDRRTMLNAMIEESRRVAISLGGGCDVFDLTATSINCDPANASAATTFANRGVLKSGASALGSLTVSRTTVAASPSCVCTWAVRSAKASSSTPMGWSPHAEARAQARARAAK